MKCSLKLCLVECCTPPQVAACKRNMNTFAFVGDLAGSPEVACVYHSEEAENQFLRNRPKAAAAAAAAAGGAADGAAAPGEQR